MRLISAVDADFIAADVRRNAVDFGKLQVFAAHFDQDCRGLWQGKPLYFNGPRCSRLWKMTPTPIPIYDKGHWTKPLRGNSVI